MSRYVICDEGDCTGTADCLLTCGTTTRRPCRRHEGTAIRDLKFLHPGQPIERGGWEAVLRSVADEQREIRYAALCARAPAPPPRRRLGQVMADLLHREGSR